MQEAYDLSQAHGQGPDMSDTDFLGRLGERVREVRAQRGMTRKMLAQDSGVSLRYLAQLETGNGNISILLLRQIAHALNMPLEDLIAEHAGRSVEMTLLHQFLTQLPPQDLGRAHQLLLERFATAAGQDRRNRIALIGLRGAGKTTLGRRLAEHLNVPFIELAREIERESGTSLTEIFALYGQATYRRYERRCLEMAIECHERAVISTGGSLVSEPGTFNLLLSSCFTVWVQASPEEHMSRVVAQGDLRPMEDNREAMEDLRRILAGRSPLYGKADTSINTSGRTIDDSFADLLDVI
jgi:XRE family transcriptional regulator, aerobic/anaerobic benzoate catabolism transcriptional regulator